MIVILRHWNKVIVYNNGVLEQYIICPSIREAERKREDIKNNLLQSGFIPDENYGPKHRLIKAAT